LQDHPRAALELVRMLVGRLRESDRRRVEFGAYDITRRLAALLVDLAMEAEAHGTDPVVRLSQHEIAGLIGASRESVARALVSLRARGLVETGRRTITVVDLEGLRTAL